MHYDNMENKKPSSKRKPVPQIKQTKASAYRILKSNPLMIHDKNAIKNLGFKNQNEIPAAVDVLGVSSKSYNKLQPFNNKNYNIHSYTVNNRNLPKSKDKKNGMIPCTNTTGNAPSECLLKNPLRVSITAMYRNKLRRSKSAEKFNPNICIKKSIFEEAASKPNASQSFEDITNESFVNMDNINLSPVRKEQTKVTLETSPYYQKFTNSTPAPLSVCMAINNDNMQYAESELRSEERTNLKISSDSSFKTPNLQNALCNLKKQIQNGHSFNKFEAQLGSIRQIYQELEEEPVYWECRAALEQNKGNISSAVQHYQRAIVQGAEVQMIAKSLDRLLQMFNIFHIRKENVNLARTRIMLDARNIFKSTIIQLALQERSSNREKEFTEEHTNFATSHRRNTRISMVHSGTSSMKISASQGEIPLQEKGVKNDA